MVRGTFIILGFEVESDAIPNYRDYIKLRNNQYKK